MGSFVELNDTLQITAEQGFPKELQLEKHLKKSFAAEQFKDKLFEFKDKLKIRLYQQPPVKNFLVQNINDKWIYWGLIHIVGVKHDRVRQTTSGKFEIIYIYTPEEMKYAHRLIDRNKETDFFKK